MKMPSKASAPSLIGASAGSGKTYRLTKVVTEAVAPSAEERVNLPGLVAVTYTQKGAAELASRIRRSFAGAGAHQSTHQLPLAYIGTVHAVCLRLVKEFAIDAGLSPLVDVVPGGEDRLLRQALEEGLEPAFRSRLDRLAAGVELRLDNKTSRFDWFRPVQDIMTLARSNRIPPERLPQMAERSVERLVQLLGLPEKDGKALDAELLAALRTTVKALTGIQDGQKNTADATKLVQESLKKAERGQLKWGDWLSLQGIRPGKTALRAVAPLQEVALRVERHPRLHAELRELTSCMYEAARQGLGAYDLWKRRRRIIDFVDMLDRALEDSMIASDPPATMANPTPRTTGSQREREGVESAGNVMKKLRPGEMHSILPGKLPDGNGYWTSGGKTLLQVVSSQGFACFSTISRNSAGHRFQVVT